MPTVAPYLLCYDGSECAGAAIRRASEILAEGPALVVHVWLAPSAMLLQGRAVAPGHPLREAAEEFDAEARTEAERLAAEGADIAAEAGLDAEPLALEVTYGVWRPIVDLAAEREARAVVVGSQGRSAASATLLGSVSRGIANHCARPVLVVPPERS
jgi:nucleotide-binding universal stress UspA family protein